MNIKKCIVNLCLIALCFLGGQARANEETIVFLPVQEAEGSELANYRNIVSKDCPLPIVFRGAAKEWKGYAEFTPERLLELYGDACFEILGKKVTDLNLPESLLDCYESFRGLEGYDENGIVLADYIQHVFHNSKDARIIDVQYCRYISDEKWNHLYPEYENSCKYTDFPEGERTNLEKIVFFMGAKNSETQFHTHPQATSLLAEFYGKKRIVLASPSAYNQLIKFEKQYALANKSSFCEQIVIVEGEERTVFDYCDIEFISNLRPEKVKDAGSFYEVILNPGDVLLIPLGWFHYVKYLEASIGASQFEYVVE